MPRAGHAQYRGLDLFVFEAWEGMNWFFVLEKGTDPKCHRGLRSTFEEALDAGSDCILEVANEQSSRSGS